MILRTGLYWALCLDREHGKPEVICVSFSFASVDSNQPEVYRIGDEIPWCVDMFRILRPCLFEHDT